LFIVVILFICFQGLACQKLSDEELYERVKKHVEVGQFDKALKLAKSIKDDYWRGQALEG
jgi:hypothetical protein